MPSEIPIVTANKKAQPPYFNVTGKPCAMISFTVRSLYRKEGPKSKLVITLKHHNNHD